MLASLNQFARSGYFCRRRPASPHPRTLGALVGYAEGTTLARARIPPAGPPWRPPTADAADPLVSPPPGTARPHRPEERCYIIRALK
eukprot:6094235-Pyramimonas_sp.AAC.1